MNYEEENFNSAVNILSPLLKNKLMALSPIIKNDTYEIRLRAGKPILLFGKYGYLFLRKDGTISSVTDEQSYICKTEIITESFNRLCCYSVYSHIESIINGYITFQGGHRAGITGTAVVNEQGNVTSVRDISSLNIRIARQIKGACDELISLIGTKKCSMIIAGPPSSGKTTVLRDYIRRMSDEMYKVVIIDERQEIASMNGIFCQHDVGLNTDVLNNFPKAKGIMNAIRTLSPDIIALDEVGEKEEIKGIINGMNSGVNFITTVHALNYKDLLSRPQVKELIQNGDFSYVVLLKGGSNPGEIENIYEASEVCDEIFRSSFIMDSVYDDGNEGFITA